MDQYAAAFYEKVRGAVGGVILGKDEVIRLACIAFLCRGHILIEDLPGTGKTIFLRAFSKAIGGTFKRVQFTPDLLPSDLTGINFYNQKTGEFEFRPGPLFANVILADEINRATPRTQSSLLEAMEERQISADGVTYPLEEPFIVMATQNPLESYGTFPLPEAQIDRFLMRLSMGYPSREEEMKLLSRGDGAKLAEALSCIISPEELRLAREDCAQVKASGEVAGYLMDIVEASRSSSVCRQGVSTRGAIALFRAAQAEAALCERNYMTPQDVKRMAPHVLNHRLSIKGASGVREAGEAVLKLVDTVAAPVEG